MAVSGLLPRQPFAARLVAQPAAGASPQDGDYRRHRFIAGQCFHSVTRFSCLGKLQPPIRLRVLPVRCG